MPSRRYLTDEEFRRRYIDSYRYLSAHRANRDFLAIAKRLQSEGSCSFPEVTLRQAKFLTGLPEKKILSALRQWRLRGRVVWGDHFIPLIDLWEFYRKNRS